MASLALNAFECFLMATPSQSRRVKSPNHGESDGVRNRPFCGFDIPHGWGSDYPVVYGIEHEIALCENLNSRPVGRTRLSDPLRNLPLCIVICCHEHDQIVSLNQRAH
jgi:hypothetical protein